MINGGFGESYINILFVVFNILEYVIKIWKKEREKWGKNLKLW